MRGGGLGERGLVGREWEARLALGTACHPRPSQNVKQLYALVCETQRYSAVLDAVIASAGLLRAEKKLRPHLAKVSSGPGPVAHAWLCTSLWDPNGAGTDVTSPGALRDELNRTETQASGGRCYLAGKGDDGKEGWGLQSPAEQVASWGRRTGM